jgi:TetR/AcrR family transcriptional regulator, tetracycline repressor protein
MTPADRPPLTREAIVRRAVAFVDEHGLGALTMRRLGQLLGVEAMSIYHHVNGREDLLEAMVTHLVDQLRVSAADEELGPVDGWQTFLQHMANGVRRLAVAHPNLFPLVATRPPAAPWLRPPLRSLAVVEEFLSGLVRRGLDDTQAVQVYKVFTSFLLGHLLLEVAEMGAATGPADEPLDEGGADVPNRDEQLSVDDYPTVQRLAVPLRHHDADAQFEQALEALLDWLDEQLSQ